MKNSNESKNGTIAVTVYEIVKAFSYTTLKKCSKSTKNIKFIHYNHPSWYTIW